MAEKIGMVSLGCAKNQVDAERLLALLRDAGYEICNDAAKCDAVIINTCGFIEDAKKESIENILDFCAMKENGLRGVIVTGCLSERYREQMAEEIPEVDAIIGIGCNGDIVSAVKRVLNGEKVQAYGEKERLSLEGDRILSGPPYSAYLKVAEGCDNRCTYCAIPLIRGPFRSRPMENILEEAKTLATGGVTELCVVAQDTTRYGEDLYGKLALPELLTKLCAVDGLKWVRILYCYPDRITDELLDVMAREEKIVKYMDIPLQHANGRILGLMNRRGDAASLKALMERIRQRVPGVILRTTMITGFPTETEAEFEELCEFVRQVEFERLGCFAYSTEEDTPAADMEQVEPEIREHRAQILMDAQAAVMERVQQKAVGKKLEVLVEGREKGRWYGRSYMDAPDIDTKVTFRDKNHHAAGDYVLVEITGGDGYDLEGRLV